MSQNSTDPEQSLNKNILLPLRQLSEAVGDFIRYWGFRRIHGQLWTQIYLAKTPLSGAELVQRLDVSKALVSPALAELVSYKLIEAIEVDGRTKAYRANPDVFSVIKNILKTREKNLIKRSIEKFEDLNSAIKMAKTDGQVFDLEKMDSLGQMITAADMALGFVIDSTEGDPLMNWTIFDENR